MANTQLKTLRLTFVITLRAYLPLRRTDYFQGYVSPHRRRIDR
ncbi:hypothetical protein [Desulfosporosinus meridiei]|nr:hypothetical protein [Desulfosporosinus meridiei]